MKTPKDRSMKPAGGAQKPGKGGNAGKGAPLGKNTTGRESDKGYKTR